MHAVVAKPPRGPPAVNTMSSSRLVHNAGRPLQRVKQRMFLQEVQTSFFKAPPCGLLWFYLEAVSVLMYF